MSVRAYLPSAQFAVIVASLALSGGLVVAAQHLAGRPPATVAGGGSAGGGEDWQRTLRQIQETSGISLPEAPSEQEVAALRDAATTNNLTDSVARTLLIDLAGAKAQGLGDDIPTQDQLVAQALARAGTATSSAYVSSDLAVVPQSQTTLRAYGNGAMAAFAAHPAASAGAVLEAAGYAVDYQDAARLEGVPAARAAYGALARELAEVPVPLTMAPLHLQLVNDLSLMAAAISDLETIVSDPLRGLRGLQEFNAAGDEAARVLTTIAGTFGKNGILFNKDEPGASWALLASAP